MQTKGGNRPNWSQSSDRGQHTRRKIEVTFNFVKLEHLEFGWCFQPPVQQVKHPASSWNHKITRRGLGGRNNSGSRFPPNNTLAVMYCTSANQQSSRPWNGNQIMFTWWYQIIVRSTHHWPLPSYPLGKLKPVRVSLRQDQTGRDKFTWLEATLYNTSRLNKHGLAKQIVCLNIKAISGVIILIQ